jgi:hypothetical protein
VGWGGFKLAGSSLSNPIQSSPALYSLPKAMGIRGREGEASRGDRKGEHGGLREREGWERREGGSEDAVMALL